MSLFKKIVLPKALSKACGIKMQFSIGNKGDFEQTYNQKKQLLNEMSSVKEHQIEKTDPHRARMM